MVKNSDEFIKSDDEKSDCGGCKKHKENEQKRNLLEKIIEEKMKQVNFLNKQCVKRQHKMKELMEDVDILTKMVKKYKK